MQGASPTLGRRVVVTGLAGAGKSTLSVALAAKTGRPEAELLETMTRQNPSGRLLTPDEVASSIAWLCHPDQAMVNGQALVIGG